MVAELTHFIGGKHVKGTSGRFTDGYQPMTGEVISSPQYIHPDGYKTEAHPAAYWRTMWMDEVENDLLFNREDEAR